MDGKTTEWRPGHTVCRCCLSEGCYKDISTEYFWMGKREVYAEMLLETFDLTVSYAQSGIPNSHSRLICEPCIARLRDAADFKRQVKECEQTFLQCLNPSTSLGIEIPVEIIEKEPLKLEKVKQEKENSYDDDFVDASEFLDNDDDDDDDDLDDQPLMNLATRLPKKENVDVMDLIDNAQPVKRKSTAKTKSSPAKKAKVKETKPATRKVKERKKKAETEDSVQTNAEIIIQHTTAYPFKMNDKCILCVYCHDVFENPEEFRQHMDEEHQTFSKELAFHNVRKTDFIKADLTDLRCRLCSEAFEDVETVADHLKNVHNMAIDSEDKLGVMPFRLFKDRFVCTICNKIVPSLLHLNRHTISHFLGYVCRICGNSYIASNGLLRHIRSKHQEDEVACKPCGRVFPNREARDRHRRTEKQCMMYSCTLCQEKFHDWKARLQHMESQHGQRKKRNKCVHCKILFCSSASYYEHFRLKHSLDCHVCKQCGLKFLTPSKYEKHLKKHTL